MTNIDINEQWERFLANNDIDVEQDNDKGINNTCINNTGNNKNNNTCIGICAPVPGEIYISTKSKIAYLNHTFNLNKIFWNIPIISYSNPIEGVIKKQMKFNSN
jgi:hypothetical protein